MRNLQLLDLMEVVQDDATEFESIDIAVHIEAHAQAQIIPNLALFGRPVPAGSVSVECINRLLLTENHFRRRLWARRIVTPVTSEWFAVRQNAGDARRRALGIYFAGPGRLGLTVRIASAEVAHHSA